MAMNAKRINDKSNKPNESFKCPELGDHIHLSTALIIADLFGELSPKSHSKVTSHIEACRDCADVYEHSKKALMSKPEYDEQTAKLGSSKPLDDATRARVEFFAMLNLRRAQLIDMLLKLLVPQSREIVTSGEYHFIPCPPTDSEAPAKPKDRDKTDIAAGEIADFVILLQDLIMDRCSNVEQMQKELPGCIDDAMGMFDITKYDRRAGSKVRGMLLHFFRKDSD
jgi:hypothetical protein